MAEYTDGSLSNLILVDEFVERGISGINCTIWTEVYRTRNAAYPGLGSLLTESTRHPGHYLIEETPKRKVGAGIVEFERIYSQIPPQHVTTESVSYTFPGASLLDTTFNNFVLPYGNGIPYTANVTGYTTNTYYATLFPDSITPDTPTLIRNAFGKVVDYTGPEFVPNQIFYASDTVTETGATTQNLPRSVVNGYTLNVIQRPTEYITQSSVSQWRGPIYVKSTTRITEPSSLS